MRVGVITEHALTKQHGTGAQLLRLLGGGDVDFFHLYFQPGHGDTSECANSHALVDQRPAWADRPGLRRLHKTLAPGWWGCGQEVRDSKFAEWRRGVDLRCDVAYVLVGSELPARRCVSLLARLNCPYVVHIMDVYHDTLEPSAMPGLQALFAGAASVLSITPAVGEQIAKFGVWDIRSVFIGQETDVPQAAPPVPGGKIRVIMSGRPYQGGVELLEQTLPALTARYPQAEFAYAGAYFKHHPPLCRQLVRDYGQIQDADAYTRLIGESHLAYLTGPCELDNFGRYSFPSRASDYLMAGLPLVACVAEGTATRQILQPLVPDAARCAVTPEQMTAAFDAYLGSEQAWCLAGQKSRAFALQTMSMGAVRQQVFDALRQAAARC